MSHWIRPGTNICPASSDYSSVCQFTPGVTISLPHSMNINKHHKQTTHFTQRKKENFIQNICRFYKKAQIMKNWSKFMHFLLMQQLSKCICFCWFLRSQHPQLKFSFCIKRPSDECVSLCWREAQTSGLRWNENCFKWSSLFTSLGAVTTGSIELRVDHCSG